MSLQETKHDIARLRSKFMTATVVDTKIALVHEVLPLLTALIEKLDERFTETEEMVTGILQGTETIIQPEVAAQIVGTLETGEKLCQAIEPHLSLLPEDAKVLVKTHLDAFRAERQATQDQIEEYVIEMEVEEPEPAAEAAP